MILCMYIPLTACTADHLYQSAESGHWLAPGHLLASLSTSILYSTDCTVPVHGITKFKVWLTVYSIKIQIFQGSAASKKIKLNSEILELGSLNNLEQCPI